MAETNSASGNQGFADEGVLRNVLCEARSYREFLKLYFGHTGRSYAEIARRAGFSSRSYPRDVTEGRRRLTARALPSFIRGLRLNARLCELFETLYFLEYPHEFPVRAGGRGVGSSTNIQDRLNTRLKLARQRVRIGKVRANIGESTRFAVPSDLRESTIRHLFEILASLGEPSVGSTLEEMSRMTGLVKPILSSILELSEREGLVRFDTKVNRYFPTSGHLNFTGIPKNELIRSIYMRSLERARLAAEAAYESDSVLCHVSAISVSRAGLPQMKKELREILLKYADTKVETESDPDTVVYVVSSMFEARVAPQ